MNYNIPLHADVGRNNNDAFSQILFASYTLTRRLSQFFSLSPLLPRGFFSRTLFFLIGVEFVNTGPGISGGN